MESEAHFTQADRQTLTKVETKLDRAIEDIKGLTNNFATKEELSVLKDELAELKPKVDKLNMKYQVAIGAIGMISAAVIPMGIYIFNHKTDIDYGAIKQSVTSAINDYNLTLTK